MKYGTASLWVFCLALGFSKAIDVIPGRIRNHGHYVCSTWGNYHFKTFDGGFYQFPGNCTYNLASHCQDSYQEFSVHVHRSLAGGHPFLDKITITIKDVTVQLKTNLVVLNGAVVKTPYYGFGILIHKSDDYVKMYTKAGLILMWNREDAVMLELDPKFNNYTCGLCGDYNGDPRHREFLLKDKTLSPINFGNQQNVNDPNEVCKDTEETEVINPARCSKYRSACEKHLRQAALSDCIQFLDLEPYIKACMIDMCSCDQSQDSFCLCSTITEYSRQCSHAGGRPGNWRTDNFCPKQCPANMIYQESASPCKSSCSHLELYSRCEEHYMDGCFCPEGTVEDNYSGRGCIPGNECFCKHQGKLYAPGESIKNDCYKCDCIAGRWNCTDLHCPKVCSVEGGVHFTTFDGKTYTFHGNCYYVLLKERRTIIVGELIPCSSSERETCLQSVVLITDNLKSIVIFKADGTVLVNYLKVTTPHITANFSILQPSKHNVVVQMTNGIQMQIQLLPKMQLYITMAKPSRKQLQGLCGNFNTKEGDDFTTSFGLVEATASAFANTWKALPTCHDISDWLEDPCSISIENKNYADYWCSKLEKSPFAKCHSIIDPTEYVKRCRYDSCTCKESEHCMCAALSSYVRACAAKGIILWGWKKGICDKDITSCPSSQTFLYNLTTCRLTCRSLAEREKACAIVYTPVDGCGCPDGQYLNEEDQCVSISKCSCFYRDTYLKPQEIINTKDKQCCFDSGDGPTCLHQNICICQNGNLVCTEQVNKTCPAGKVYFDCNKSHLQLSGAPIRRSCKTPTVEYFQTECISGCGCPYGLLDDGSGGCVPEDQCPCVHNEDIYPHGSQIKADCNTCLCQRGRWDCTKTDCHGTCTIYGNGHYISFDNKIYEFDGNCEFVAAQDYCETNSSAGSFSVLTENIPCGTTGVTCSKSVKVFLGNTMLKLSEKHVVKTVAEGGEHVDYITREVGIYLVIEASNRILLIWDKKTTIFIKVPPAYKGKLCGLCGNFDDNSQNDFRTRHMIQVIDVLEFGNSWKVDATCPDATDVADPCTKNPHRHSWAEKRCGLIKSQVFKICHSKVDPKPFYEACVKDACSCDSGGDCDCFCTAVAVYAHECSKAEACVYWRTPEICPIFCDYYNPKGECEWHYHPCGNHTVPTCHSFNKIYTNVTMTYLEGCYPTCPKNKPIFDEANKQCVTKEECGCYINDIHYKSGAEVPQYMKCHKCVCSSNGNIDCEKLEVSSCSSTTPIITTPLTSATSSQTAATEVTTRNPKTIVTPHSTTTCVSKKKCQWTQWFDVSKPGDDLASGDNETYEEIRKHHTFCEVPEKIQFRAENAPDVSLDDLKQVVHCNVSYGLLCRNSEQKPRDNLWQKCYNYEIRVKCCYWICFESTPLTTTPIVSTTTAALQTSKTVDTTTGSTTLSPFITAELTTPDPGIHIKVPLATSFTALPQAPCAPTCSWSEWFSVTYPTHENGGDNETYHNIRQAGHDVCEVPSRISCRARHWPDRALHELGQKVTCDISYGLICKNEEQGGFECFDYEIRVYCCRLPDMCLPTTPRLKTSTPHITTPSSSGTNTTRRTTKSTRFSETSSHTPATQRSTSTHATSSVTTAHNTRTKKTTITSPASEADIIKTVPEPTQSSTTAVSFTPIIPSPTTTAITIVPTPPPTNTSTIPPKTSTKNLRPAASSASTVVYTHKQVITKKGSLTSTAKSTSKTASEYTSNKATSVASTTTTNVDGTTTASMTFSTTSKGRHTPTKSTPTETEATGAINTFPYTTSEVTMLKNSTKTTATSSTAPSMSTSKVRTISTPTELRQTSHISPTKPITYQSMKTMPTSTTKSTSRLTTQATSTLPVQSTMESTTTSTIPRLIDSTTSSITTTGSLKMTMPKTFTVHTISETSPTTRSVITSSPVPTTVEETSFSSGTVCICVYNGTTYHPGEIISTVSEGSWCHQVICSMECELEVNNWLCSTSVPALPSTPDTSPTSPQMTSTIYSAAHKGSSSEKMTTMVSSTTEKRGCSFEQFREVNETWMLNNCTKARCLEDHTVEITELMCESPTMITCANGEKPIAVADGDQCCWHWECDCVCFIWGDPHYKTFDGTYYTFQGNCTYTLVEEIEKKNHFRIDIDNYDCGAIDGVSCPRNISVLYNTQEIQFVVHGLDVIHIQVAVNGEIIGTPYKRNGVTIYTLGVYYVVEIPELGAYIQYNGMNLKIKLPYDRFGHNTQGQCGTCTNNQSDDCRTRNGNIVPNCELMADSWIIEDPQKPECVNNTIPGTPPPLSTCHPTSLCSLIKGPIFQKCHNVVSPDDFYKACVYDSCHVPRSGIECSSLQHYAQLCGDKGICIDWRSQVPECSMPCPSHKVYNACGPAKPRTCETIQEEHLRRKDDEHLVEGCFCPRGTVRFSPAVDICVRTCGCVGPDNVPRKFGERFPMGCQDCICIDGGSGITCQKHKCKEKTEVQCHLEGFYPDIQISPTDPCCNESVCKCDTSRCKTTSPNCVLGYEAIGGIPEGHCCSQYQCVPKKVCVHGGAEYMLGAPVYTEDCQSCVCAEGANTTTGLGIRCTDITHDEQCPVGFTLRKSRKHCCGECEQTHCVLNPNGSMTSYYFIQPGEMILSEDNCTLYSCDVISNQFITSVTQISCPYFNEDDCEPGTTELLPNGCCKVCATKMTSCKLNEYYDYLSYNNCRSADLVKMSRCDGSCATFSIYSSEAKSMSHKCASCREVQTSQKHAVLQCSDGRQVEHEYMVVEKCDCMNTECGPVKLNEEITSKAPNGKTKLT